MTQRTIHDRQGKTIDIYTIPVGLLQANCYIVCSSNQYADIIDPGDDGEYLSDVVTRLKLTPRAIFLTHGHFDHMLAAFQLQETYDIPVYVSKKDMDIVGRMQTTAKKYLGYAVPDLPPRNMKFYEDHKEEIEKCGVSLRYLPGHTPGGVGISFGEFPCVFIGDVLFADGSRGATNHAYSNAQTLHRSLHNLLAMPPTTTLFPGHGLAMTVGAVLPLIDAQSGNVALET